jgi:hypothetical protein
MVPQHVHDEIQKLRTNKTSGAWMYEDTRGITQHMMMLEANHDRIHKATSSCMATLDCRTKNHGYSETGSAGFEKQPKCEYV